MTERDAARRDVAVIGGGPAGLAVAASLARRGLDTVVVAAEPEWHATYGAWRDDVAHCELGAPLDSVLRGAWPAVRVVGEREHMLQRPYVVFDNARLRASLAQGVHVHAATADAVLHDVETSTVRLRDGASITARLVIDATGGGAFLARRDPARSGRAPGAQRAYGLYLSGTRRDLARMGIEAGVFTLMDWSTPPTFLYGAVFDGGEALVEETSLYADPPHDIDDLRERLAARLGTDASPEASRVERVHIPMGSALPARTTRTVGFGAAAGYIHPVTGYSVAASLRAAPRVAAAVQASMRQARHGSDLSLAAWASVWPAALVRTRAWHEMGLAVLRSLPADTIPEFFDAFFDLPRHVFADYLRIDSEPARVRAAMLGVFRSVQPRTRLRLMAQPAALLRALGAR